MDSDEQLLTDAGRNELLGAALDQWEEENGPITAEELDAAAAALKLSPGQKRGS